MDSMYLCPAQYRRLPAPYKVNNQLLLGPAEELVIMPAFEILLQSLLRAQVHPVLASYTHHQDVLFRRNAHFVVVGDFVVAVEGQSILHVPPHPEDGHGFTRRYDRRQSLR